MDILTLKYETNPCIFHLIFPPNLFAKSYVVIPRNACFNNKYLIFALHENTLNSKKLYEIIGERIYKVHWTIVLHMVTQEFAHKTLLKLLAFMYLNFPNNRLKNIPSRIVYAKRSQLFIITSRVSAKVCARHYSPGKHPSQFAKTLLFWAGSEAWVQRNTFHFFLASVKFRVKEQTYEKTKGIENHSTGSSALYWVKRISMGDPAVKLIACDEGVD